jgi:hypothetical protein
MPTRESLHRSAGQLCKNLSVQPRKFLIAILAIALLVMIALWTAKPGHAPAGQPPLAHIPRGDIHLLIQAFNQDSTKARIILMLSPT